MFATSKAVMRSLGNFHKDEDGMEPVAVAALLGIGALILIAVKVYQSKVQNHSASKVEQLLNDAAYDATAPRPSPLSNRPPHHSGPLVDLP